MDRDTLCIEQSGWYQANGIGENIWLPLGSDSDRWLMWRQKAHTTTTDGVTCRDLNELWSAQCFEGSYFWANTSQYTLPDGAWAATTKTDGLRYLYHNTRRLQLAVPAGTTDVWVLFHKASSGGLASFYATAGKLLLSSIDTSTGAGIVGNGLEPNELIHLATDCGGGTITLTPSANYVYLVGFLCLNKNTPGDPLTGVFDPESLVLHQRSDQSANGPIKFKFGAGGTSFFWGHGHWTALQTAINETSSVLADVAAWSPAADTWVRTQVSDVQVQLLADIQANDGSSNHTVGTFEETYFFSPSGLRIGMRYVFNATAEAQDLRIPAAPDCGYCGQWGLTQNLTSVRRLPMDASRLSVTAPWDDSAVAQGNAAIWAMYGGSVQALFIGRTSVGETTGFVSKRSDLGGWPKIYKYANLEAEIDLVDGDVIESEHWRILTHAGQLSFANAEDLAAATAEVAGGIVSIQARTDLLPDDPASEALVQSAVDQAALAYSAAASASAAAVQANGKLPADTSTKLGRLDAAISTMATAAALTTLDGKADAIQAQTDKLPASPASETTLEALGDDVDSAIAIAATARDAALSADGKLPAGTATLLAHLDADITAAKLASDGLDAVLVVEPATAEEAHTTLAKAVGWLLRRFIGHTTLTKTDEGSGTLVVTNSSDETISTQAVTDNGTTQDQGEAV